MRLLSPHLLAFLCLALLTRQAFSDPPRTDRYGDPLPDGAAYRVGTTRLRLASIYVPRFNNLLLSPGGKYVFSSVDGEDDVCMWETATGRIVRRFPATASGPLFSLSADGSLLAVGHGNKLIHLYDTATGNKHRSIDLSPLDLAWSISITFSPDGKSLTVCHLEGYLDERLRRIHQGHDNNKNGISRWEIATGKMIGSWKMGMDAPVALSVDNRLLASLREKEPNLCLWEMPSSKKIRESKLRAVVPLGSRCLTISPDGRDVVIAGKDAMIRVYETATGKEVRSWKGRTRNEDSGESNHAVEIGWLAFSPDGKTLASVDCNFVLRLWDWATGRELRHFDGIYGPVSFSADGKIITAGGEDSSIRIWDVATGHDLPPFADLGRITAVAFSPDARVLGVGSDHGLSRLLDASNGRELKQIPGYRLLRFSPDGASLLALRQNGQRLGPLCILDVSSGKERVQFRDTNELDERISWSPDGKLLVTINWFRKVPVRAWDTATGKIMREFRGKENDAVPPSQIEWLYADCSVDAQTLALVEKVPDIFQWENNIVHILATDTGKELHRLKGYIVSVDYSANDRQISIRDKLSPVFSPDGRAVLGGCEGNSFGLWDIASGKRTVSWKCTDLIPRGLKFSPDSKWLALLDPRGEPCLVDTKTGRLRHRLRWKDKDVSWMIHSDSQTFSPDSRLLATAYNAHTIVLWEVATGRPVRTWPGHGQGKLDQMAFSSDSRRLATVSRDGTALVWDVTGLSPDGKLPARKLTRAETEQAWRDLDDADAAKAHRALWALVADPERALPRLREHLHPAPGIDPRRLARLIGNLDSDDFTLRETATRELRKMSKLAEPALRAALKDKPSLELRRRVQGLLEEIDNAIPPADRLHDLRAVAVLEHIASEEARQLLGVLADGAAGARLTQEAKVSLERLRSRRVQP